MLTQPQTAASAPAAELTEVWAENVLGIEPQALKSISGRVFNQAGQPLAGVEIFAGWTRLFEVDELAVDAEIEREKNTQTDFSGEYRFSPLLDGEYLVRIPATERFGAASIAVRAGVQAADLLLREKGRELRIYGTVTDADDLPLAGVKVLPSGLALIETNDAGSYEYRQALPDRDQRFDVWFKHPDFHDELLSIQPADYQSVSELALDLSLQPLELIAEVTGRVLDADGRPLSGQPVRLTSTQVNRTYNAVTAGNGSFRFPEVVAASDYDLQIYPEGSYTAYRRQSLAVGVDGLYLPVQLEPLAVGRVRGRITDFNGAPLPGFNLYVNSRSALHLLLPVTADAEGYYTLEEVPTGELTFQTRSTPSISVRGYRLEAGAELTADLVVDWGEHRLSGLLLDDEDQPVAGARIYLDWSLSEQGIRSTVSRQTVSDAQGWFLFSQLGPGRHQVRVTGAAGFAPLGTAYEAGASGGDLILRLVPLL